MAMKFVTSMLLGKGNTVAKFVHDRPPDGELWAPIFANAWILAKPLDDIVCY